MKRPHSPGPVLRLVRALRGALRSARNEWRARYVWDGIYADFNEMPSVSATFDEEKWAEDTRRLTVNTLAECQTEAFPAAACGDASLLPMLVGTLVGEGGRLRILDFGGGAGVSYAVLRAAVPALSEVDYVVVEMSAVARVGGEIFANDPSIRFVEDATNIAEPVDIVFVSTALQYVDNWRSELTKFAGLSPRYILLSRTAAGDVPTHVAAQVNLKGHQIPYRFLNIDDLSQHLEDLGYAMIFKGASLDSFDRGNYPATHRLERYCNLLYQKRLSA